MADNSNAPPKPPKAKRVPKTTAKNPSDPQSKKGKQKKPDAAAGSPATPPSPTTTASTTSSGLTITVPRNQGPNGAAVGHENTSGGGSTTGGNSAPRVPATNMSMGDASTRPNTSGDASQAPGGLSHGRANTSLHAGNGPAAPAGGNSSDAMAQLTALLTQNPEFLAQAMVLMGQSTKTAPPERPTNGRSSGRRSPKKPTRPNPPVARDPESGKKIPKRKKGQSIQVGMRLTNESPLYNAIQDTVHHYVDRADIPEGKSWHKAPLDKKALVIQGVANKIPYMRRMQDDWATEHLASQYMANQRKRKYKKGLLAVPEQYTHLKENAAKRKTSGSRVKMARRIREEKARRRAEREQERMGEPARKRRRIYQASTEQPEFVEGSSRDGQRHSDDEDSDDEFGNSDDAHPTIDKSYKPYEDEDEDDESDEDSE
uniref:Uncharacterized protein n=1 Tax=Mycena chlorophos TaxID=658473 RepID=A0ABQ0KVX2_MYCCL|nr:predicted protein [Mycena chlorophos]